jgi:hypothetical protein
MTGGVELQLREPQRQRDPHRDTGERDHDGVERPYGPASSARVQQP